MLSFPSCRASRLHFLRIVCRVPRKMYRINYSRAQGPFFGSLSNLLLKRSAPILCGLGLQVAGGVRAEGSGSKSLWGRVP